MEYMWITGNKKEVKKLVEALRANGFTFELTHYAEISNSPFGGNRYSYTLRNFRPPRGVGSSASTVGCSARRCELNESDVSG